MGRLQTGHVYKALGAWHLRCRVTEENNHKLIRVQKSERLRGGNRNRSQAKKIAAGKCRRSTQGTTNNDLLIPDFWEQAYEPWLEKTGAEFLIVLAK